MIPHLLLLFLDPACCAHRRRGRPCSGPRRRGRPAPRQLHGQLLLLPIQVNEPLSVRLVGVLGHVQRIVDGLEDFLLHSEEPLLEGQLVLVDGGGVRETCKVDVERVYEVSLVEETLLVVVYEDELFVEFDGKGDAGREKPRDLLQRGVTCGNWRS
jgi:hypothetical protein